MFSDDDSTDRKALGSGEVTGMKHGHKKEDSCAWQQNNRTSPMQAKFFHNNNLTIKLLARFYETESFMAVLRDVLDKFLPDDVHIRSNGRVRGKNDSPPLTIQLILTIGKGMGKSYNITRPIWHAFRLQDTLSFVSAYTPHGCSLLSELREVWLLEMAVPLLPLADLSFCWRREMQLAALQRDFIQTFHLCKDKIV
ncbi:hypothetical protein CK203_047607 [Vitis vinifera]|uniref:Uncharacterized protein n=1 Tax=Vitis vinifera TaxID=29760 RepID=A0A438H5E9_VITVI|nr:hypothetical protein CK203_047607 [Vitis vinifera]